MRVVFACKSNTCRSQMAEGWAKSWLDKYYDHVRPESKENDSLLPHDQVHILSVALDSSSIWNDENDDATVPCPTNDERLRSNHRDLKSVKVGAIEAMATDGVDISNYYPKSAKEAMMLSQPFSSATKCNNSMFDIDRLVLLCNCATGNVEAQKLVRSSARVIEWEVPAPSALYNSGNEDAYVETSRNIRDKVDRMLEELLGTIE
mmetsp:Transcript_14383/g.28751  ORF Transcript_14383/g.28751 Transcript_14383/m.28751 type:complete len:205 (-) Transcript_14383:217-831(-)